MEGSERWLGSAASFAKQRETAVCARRMGSGSTERQHCSRPPAGVPLPPAIPFPHLRQVRLAFKANPTRRHSCQLPLGRQAPFGRQAAGMAAGAALSSGGRQQTQGTHGRELLTDVHWMWGGEGRSAAFRELASKRCGFTCEWCEDSLPGAHKQRIVMP